jgi:hypothetical protein
MSEPLWNQMIRELKDKHQIPDERFFGLDAESMSRAIVAMMNGPMEKDRPVGFFPVVSREIHHQWIREAFGSAVNAERIQLQVDFFMGKLSDLIPVDWTLPDDQFAKVVREGLDREFPDLSEDARRVILANYSYSHTK